MGSEQSHEEKQKTEKLPINRNQSSKNLQTDQLSQLLVKNKPKEDIINHKKNESMQVYLQLGSQVSKQPVVPSSPLKEKSNIIDDSLFNERPSKMLDRSKDFRSQQQLQTKKPPMLDQIKKMKQRVEDEVSPITITRITDHKHSFASNLRDETQFESKLNVSNIQNQPARKLEHQNSFVSNVSEMKKLIQKDESQILFSQDKSLFADIGKENKSSPEIKNSPHNSDSNQEANLYDYYLRYQKQKQKQFGQRKQSENQCVPQGQLIPTGQFCQTEPPTINNSVRQSFQMQALPPFITQPYDANTYQVQAQLAQLAYENQELKSKLTQQQILQMQFQQQLLQQFQSQQTRIDTQAQNNENRAPIIINNNIVSPDNYKQMKPLFEEQQPQAVQCYYTSRKESTHQSTDNAQSLASIAKTQEVKQSQQAAVMLSTETFLPKASESEVKLSDLEVLQSETQKSTQKKEQQISKGDDRKAIKLDFNFDSEKKEKQGKSLAQCFMERKKTVEIQKTYRNDEEEEKQEWIVKVNKRSKEEQMKLRREMMDYGKNIRRNETVKKQCSEQKSQERYRSPQAKANSELMQRLANGQKAKVNNKDMIALTKKNYDNLPEIKRKKEEDQKKQDKNEFLKERQNKIKELNSKIKNKLFKKKEQ